MRKKIFKIFVILAGLLYLLSCATKEREAFLYNVSIFSKEKFILKPFPVTIDVTREFYPTVSVKDNYIVYVSDKTGNLDLWLYDIKTRNNFRLTYHSSDDTMPSFSPDGEKLIFISYRSDSTGDIWLFDISKIKERVKVGLDEDYIKKLLKDDEAEPLVLSPFPETEPRFMPNGEYIVFVREETNGIKNIFLKKAKLKADERKLTYTGAVSPAPSPDGKLLAYIDVSTNTNKKGHIFLLNLITGKKTQITYKNSIEFSPYFINNYKIAYSSIKFDSNHNGKIEIGDNSALYLYSLKTKKEKQLTSGKYYDTNPVYSKLYKGVIIFSSTRENNVDIWMLPETGIIPDFKNSEKQLELGFKLNDNYLRITAFKKFLYNFPESEKAKEAKYQIAKSLANLGFIDNSNEYLKQILKDETNVSPIYVKSKIQFILNKYIQTDNIEQAISKLLKLKKETFQKEERSIIDFSIANLYFKIKKINKALKYYGNIVKRLPIDAPLSLKSREKLIKIFSLLNQHRSAEKVLKNFSTSTNLLLKLKFQKKLFDTYFISIPDIQKEIEYKDFIKKFKYDKDFYLNAKIEYASFLIKKKKIKKARKLLKEIIKEDDTSHSYFKFLGWIKLSEITSSTRRKNYLLNAINIKLPNFLESQKEQPKLNLISLLLNEAQNNFNKRKYLKAKRTYNFILKFDRNNIPAMAGKIRCDFKLIPPSEEKYNKILEKYKKLILEKPYEYVYHYILGYGYSLIYSYYFQLYQSKKAKDESIKYPLKKLKEYFKLAEEQIQIAYRLKPDLIESYLTLGWLYQLQDEIKGISERKFLEEAIPLYFSALHYNDESKNPYNEAMLCLNLANIYFKLQNYSTAYKYYEKKLEFYKEFQSPIQEAFFYYHFGYSAWFIEKDKAARENFLKAWKAFLKSNEKYYALRSLIYVAMIDRIIGNYQSAIENYEKGIKFIKKNNLDINPERLYREIGICYQNLNKSEKALEYFFKAEKIIPKDPKISWWKRPAIRVTLFDRFSIPIFPMKISLGASFAYQGFKNRDEQKLLYSLISDTYFNFLNYPESLKFLLKKKSLLEEDKNFDALPPLYNQIALVYYKLNNFKKAEEYFRLSNKYNEKSKKFKNDKGIIINNLNLIEIIMNQKKDVHKYFDEAKEILDESIQLAEKIKKNEKMLIKIYSLYGLLYFKLAEQINLNKKYNKSIRKTLKFIKKDLTPYIYALKYYNKAYNLAIKNKIKDVATKIKFNTGMVYFNSYDYEKAKEILQSSKNDAEKYFLKDVEWKSTYLLTKINNNLDSSAEDILNVIDAQPKGYNYNINNDPLIKKAYDDIIEMYIRQHNYIKAVETIERYKNFKIKEIFNSYPIAIKEKDKKLYYQFKNQEHKILNKIDSFHKFLRRKKKDAKKYFEFLSEIENLYKSRDTLNNKIKKENPQLSYYIYKNIPSITNIQCCFGKKDAILEFYITESNINVILIDSTNLNIFSTNYAQRKFEILVDRFYESLVDKDRDYIAYRKKLYNILVLPFESIITNVSNITIIPDSCIYKVPFNILLTNKNITYDISLTQFYFNKGKNSDITEKLIILNSESKLNRLNNKLNFPPDAVSQKRFKKILQSGDIMFIPDGIKINPQTPPNFKLFYNDDYTMDSISISDFEKFPKLISIEKIENPELLNEDTILGIITTIYYSGATTVLLPIWNLKDKYLCNFLNNFYSSTQKSFIEKYNYAREKTKTEEEEPFYYESKLVFGNTGIIRKEKKKMLITKKETKEKVLDIEYYITNADRSFKTNEYNEAIKNYIKAYENFIGQTNIKTNERLLYVMEKIVESYIAIENLDDALEWAEKGAKLLPEKFNKIASELSFKLEEYDKALSYITNVNELTQEDYILKAKIITSSDIEFNKKIKMINQALTNFIKFTNNNFKEFFDIFVDFLVKNNSFTNLYRVINIYKNLISGNDNKVFFTNIQQTLKENTLLCDFYLSPQYIISFFITKSNINFNFEKSKKIEKIIKSFSNNIVQKAEEDDIKDDLNNFYKILFKKQNLTKFSNIYVFPESKLFNIPFNALYNGKCYLIDKHFIVTISSYTGLIDKSYILDYKIFGIGYQLNLPGKIIKDFSYKEIEEIEYFYPRSYTIINDIKTPKKKSFNIFHIALQTYFTNNKYYFINPGFIEKKIIPERILQLDKKRDLIFLSKFEGIKTDRIDRIIYNFNKITRNCILNLHRMSDVSSAIFVKKFYTSLKETHSLDESFYITQKQIKQIYSNPLLWSNFIFICCGDGAKLY